MEIVLFESESPGLSIKVLASFDEDGHLLIKGNDWGEVVKKLLGDFDYEYSLNVLKSNIHDLYSLLNPNSEVELYNIQPVLLSAIFAKIAGERAFINFKGYCSNNKIPFEEFYWT